jgi:hypothetical protein
MLQAVVADGGRSAEIAWAVGVPWQGQGIAFEAAQAVVAWLEARGVQTITAHSNPDHGASIAVATRVGLQGLGKVRECLVHGPVMLRSAGLGWRRGRCCAGRRRGASAVAARCRWARLRRRAVPVGRCRLHDAAGSAPGSHARRPT